MLDETPDNTLRKSQAYGRRWRRLRLEHLAEHPFCIYCFKEGKDVLATVVDHIVRHRGNRDLLYERTNLQSLCKRHHDSDKQAEERAPVRATCDVDGYPVEGNW